MLEESVEGFVSRFRSSAADVVLSGRVEGNPLLECLVNGIAVHAFERTGPYLASSGPARVILNLECDEIVRLADDAPPSDPAITVIGVSALAVDGVVVMRDDPFLVVEAGARFVVGLTCPVPDLAEGDRVRFVSRAPIHAFVLPRSTARSGASKDDQV